MWHTNRIFITHLLGILVLPIASNVIPFKQSWNPVDHFHLALASRLTLFLLQ